ncbi:MAG: AraC family transcriptional regulator [Acidimicrobiia bacterium]
MVYEPPLDELVPAGELVDALARRTPLPGPNRSEWRGLTCYRFERPQTPHWDEVRSLSLCVVVQGRKRVRIGSTDYFYDPFNYFVMTRGMRFQAEILEASPVKPYLSFVLQVEPAVVNRVIADIHERTTVLYQPPLPKPPAAYVTAFDQNLIGAVLRFLRSLDTEADRRVLAPIYLQEMVYRVLQTEQCSRLAEAAMREADTNPVSASIAYMQEDLSRPLTVADLADAVAMSQSAFAHLFKSVTGVSPYQFAKRLRLDRARVMLVEEARSVSEAAAMVGYSSLSHFINEFKRHFGVTPGLYAESVRGAVPLSVSQATSR